MVSSRWWLQDSQNFYMAALGSQRCVSWTVSHSIIKPSKSHSKPSSTFYWSSLEKKTAQVEGYCLFQLHQGRERSCPTSQQRNANITLNKEPEGLFIFKKYSPQHNDSWNSTWTHLKFTNEITSVDFSWVNSVCISNYICGSPRQLIQGRVFAW